MDFDTPAVRDKSSKVKPLSSRKRCRVAPTSGGAAGAAELALVVLLATTFAITFFIVSLAKSNKHR